MWGQPAGPPSSPAIANVSAAGAHIYAPRKWGILQVRLANPYDEPVEMFATTFFVDEPTLQFGRRVWVPPRARIQAWHPVLIPAKVSDGGKRADFRTLVTQTGAPHQDQDREVLIRSDSGHLQLDGSLQVSNSEPVTGIIDLESISDAVNDVAPVELLIAAQSAENLKRHNALLVEQIFAPGEESLHALDQLVMVDGRVAHDAAGLEAVRRWLFGGGHLWVMLDRVDAGVLELLLGDEFVCEVIERVGLTNIQIEPADQDASRRSTEQYDHPVDFLRVAVSHVDVAYTVDGWPAAFWKPCGEGLVLVTTLGARGWMHSRNRSDKLPALPPNSPEANAPAGNPPVGPLALPASGGSKPPMEPAPQQDAPNSRERFAPLNSMKSLAAKFFSPRPATLLPAAALEPRVEEYVGYSIPPRWLIATLLSALCLVIGGMAVFLWRLARPEILGWAGPALALAISVVLVFIGRLHRGAVPPTVASLQFVEPAPGTNDVRVHGVTGLFSSEGGPATIAGDKGGWLVPDMAGLEGQTRRLVWTDLDQWRWENFSELVGLRSANFSASVATSEKVEGRATFGSSGIEGRLHVGANRPVTDAILATRDGRFGVQVDGDGRFNAGPGDVLAPGQFLAGAIWSDEQNRRAKVVEMLLADPQRQDYPATPQLLFWTAPWDVGFEFDAGRKALGAALVVVPLHWERPPPGTHARIPAPLLPYRGAIGPDGLQLTGLWDHRKRRWQAKSTPSATWLRFQIPDVLLPAKIERARLTLHVSGPVGKLEVAGRRLNDAVPINTWIDPGGKLSLEITQTELLPITADGGLLLRVSGGDASRPELTRPDPADNSKSVNWQIESLALELDVVTATGRRQSAPAEEAK